MLSLTFAPRGALSQRVLAGFGLYSVGAGLFAAAYTITFLYGGVAFSEAVGVVVCNVGTAYLLGVLACAVASSLMRLPWPLQLTTHVAAAGLYSWGWYALLRTAFAAADWLQSGTFRITSFPPQVLTWQICQGLIVYALLAAATYAFIYATDHTPVGAEISTQPDRPIRRFLTKRGDRIEPVDVDEIVAISGADDYSEVQTAGGRHLVRMPLAEFERRLEPSRFLRVHRSTIINFDRLLCAEPAGGGRLLLHLEGGRTVQVSRAGAQRLRERIV